MENSELQKVLIKKSFTIFEAVEVLNKSHLKVVLVVDENNSLLGIVNDGDVRRAVLNKVSFGSHVKEIMVRTPTVAFESNTDKEIFALMKRTYCYQLPILNDRGVVVDLRLLSEFLDVGFVDNLVVIMAGGLGERLHPLTETVPKPLIKIGGTSVLLILLRRLVDAGFNNFAISINYKAEMIKDVINADKEFSSKVVFIEEKERLGTAGSLSLLKNRPTKTFFVINADLLTLVDFKAMLQFHNFEQNDMTIGVKEEVYQIPYGAVELNNSKVIKITEKPKHSYFLNAGIYVLNPHVIDFVPFSQYYELTDLITDMINRGKVVGSFPVHEYWLDIGNHRELRKAKEDYIIHF